MNLLLYILLHCHYVKQHYCFKYRNETFCVDVDEKIYLIFSLLLTLTLKIVNNNKIITLLKQIGPFRKGFKTTIK